MRPAAFARCALPSPPLRMPRASSHILCARVSVVCRVLVIWRYITDPAVGPFSRVKRNTLSPVELAELRQEAAAGTESCK